MYFPLLIISFLFFLLEYIDTCSNGCLKCYAGGLCISCKEGYYGIKNNSEDNGFYKCEKCKVENCKNCSETIDKCLSCKYGYYLIGNNNCTKCNSSCETCENNATNCLSCSNGRYLLNSKCPTCSSPCKTCENTAYNCLSCEEKYYKSGANCLSCVSPCETCSSATSCKSCEDGHYLSGIECLPCNSSCKTCEPPGTKCLSCFDGYYLSYPQCLPCDFPCKTCEHPGNSCLSCIDGYYLSGTQCLPCDSNCKTCEDTPTNCLSCNKSFYLTPNKACESCPSICEECENENNCTSCINDYFLLENKCYQCNINCSTTNDNCKCETCEDGFYLKNFQCLQCDSLCKTCLQKNLCTQCIDNYYKKKDDTLNDGSNFKCYKDPERYYLDNNIYRKCYQSCFSCNIGGNKTFHNCSECDVNLSFEYLRNDYINCYENCSNYYYFASGDDFHCTYNLSCPYDYPYLLENKLECIELNLDEILDNLLSDGLNGTESREEEIKFYDNILSSFEDIFTSNIYDTSDIDNGKEQILNTGKITMTFTSIENQKNNIKNNLNNVTTIDLGQCEEKLRQDYKIPDNEKLYMKKLDIIQEGMKTVKVEYDIYAKLGGNNLICLNLTACGKNQIYISIPINITEPIYKINSSSSYYNDICFTTTSEDGTDITMKDRQTEFIDNKISCQDGCYLYEYDYTNSKANCSCRAKKCSQSFAGMNIDKKKILENFKNIDNLINFKFLVCYKKLFNKEGLLKNIGSYIIFSIIIFHIITIFIFSLKQFSSIDKKIEKIVSEKLKLLSKENDYNKKKYTNNKKISIMEPIIYQIFNEIYLNRNISPIIYNKSLYNDSKLEINLKKIKRVKINNAINNIKNNKENLKNYIDEEINNFSYELSLKIDKRTYWQYYVSLLKTQHNLICAIFNNNDYNFRIIKIDLFMIGFTIEYTINALFYNDDTMHEIYENKGDFDLETQLPIAIYSTFISTILNYPLNFLALSNDAIINFKEDISKNNIKKKAKELKKKLFIKFTVYFIISFLFLILFWYYISIFGVIYRNTQMHLLKDTLISVGLSLIIPFGVYLIPGIFRLTSLSKKDKKRKYLYNLSKFLQSF